MHVEIRDVAERANIALQETHALIGIKPEIGEDWRIDLDRAADHAVGLVNQPELPVISSNRPQGALGEVEDFMPVGGTLAGQKVQLVEAVEVDFEGGVAEFLRSEERRVGNEG